MQLLLALEAGASESLARELGQRYSGLRVEEALGEDVKRTAKWAASLASTHTASTPAFDFKALSFF